MKSIKMKNIYVIIRSPNPWRRYFEIVTEHEDGRRLETVSSPESVQKMIYLLDRIPETMTVHVLGDRLEVTGDIVVPGIH